MDIYVPFDATDPKTRLADSLDPEERDALAAAMLADVIDAVRSAGRSPTVLATADVAADAPVEVDDRSLTDAVNARLGDGPVAVVAADLALATADPLERLFAAEGDVVIAPGRGGGTNCLVARDPAFRVDYHGASVRDHRRIAREIGAMVAELDSYRLATDIDERGDLVEVLLHGEGRAADWLARRFDLAVEDGRVGVRRR